MSLTLNMVGGGGGGGISATDALLRVQAPAGSTVTIAKGAVTKTDLGHENADNHTIYDYYFIIHQSQFDSVNAWTVTATRGTDTNSKTVIINASNEYNVVLSYHVPIDLYQEVEYIENTGSAWINYNISTAVNFRAVLKTCAVEATCLALFGFYTGSGSTNTWRVNVKYSNGKYCYYANAGESQDVYVNADINYGVLADIEYTQASGSQSLTVNGYSASSSYGGVAAKDTCSSFRYRGGSIANAKGKLQHAELYNNGVLVRDMWSCYRLSDSVAGMWDRVSETFFINAGSGTFVLGADV